MHHSPVAEPHIKGIIPSRRKAPDLLSCSSSATKRSGSFSGDSRTQHVRCLLCFIGCLPVWQKKTISAYCLCTTAKHFSSSGTLYLLLSKKTPVHNFVCHAFPSSPLHACRCLLLCLCSRPCQNYEWLRNAPRCCILWIYYRQSMAHSPRMRQQPHLEAARLHRTVLTGTAASAQCLGAAAGSPCRT